MKHGQEDKDTTCVDQRGCSGTEGDGAPKNGSSQDRPLSEADGRRHPAKGDRSGNIPGHEGLISTAAVSITLGLGEQVVCS